MIPPFECEHYCTSLLKAVNECYDSLLLLLIFYFCLKAFKTMNTDRSLTIRCLDG